MSFPHDTEGLRLYQGSEQGRGRERWGCGLWTVPRRMWGLEPSLRSAALVCSVQKGPQVCGPGSCSPCFLCQFTNFSGCDIFPPASLCRAMKNGRKPQTPGPTCQKV